jgi:excisionase family DNA binding protein
VSDLADPTRHALARLSELFAEAAAVLAGMAQQPPRPDLLPEPERLLTAAEAAARLGTTMDHVWAMQRRGALPSVPVGRKYKRVPLSAVLAHMANKAMPALPAAPSTLRMRTPRIGRTPAG